MIHISLWQETLVSLMHIWSFYAWKRLRAGLVASRARKGVSADSDRVCGATYSALWSPVSRIELPMTEVRCCQSAELVPVAILLPFCCYSVLDF
jgi:hypothetical protein